jgi:DNA-binding transcriptional LysR family regulator
MAEEVAKLTKGVERILPDMNAIEFPIWLTTHRELHTSGKIRLVYDVLAEALANP